MAIHQMGPPTLPVTTALGKHLRVVLSSGKLVVADATTFELGTTERATFAADEKVAVLTPFYQSVETMVAVDAFAAGAAVFAAAGGKIDDSGTLQIGYALDASGADGDFVRVIRTAGNTTA